MKPAAAARAHLLEERADLVRAVLSCADAVAAGWDGAATAERDRVVPPLRACLDRAGALEAFPDALAGAVAAAGYDLPADPVPAPPYVTVTSRGPVLRATLADGRPRPDEADRSQSTGRLVITLRAFDVKRGCGEVRYVRGPDEPGEAVDVEMLDTR